MGLPLYHAPVESDIKPKTPRDSTARARSTIRRPTRSDFEASLNRYYANRNRVPSDRTVRLQSANGLAHAARLHASLDLDENAGSTDSAPTLRWIGPRAAILSDTPSRLQATTRQNDANPSAPRRTPVLQEVVDVSDISREMARFFGEQLTVLRPEQYSRSSQTPEPASENQDRGPGPRLIPRPIIRHRASTPRPSSRDRENQRIPDANRPRPPRQSYGRRLLDQLRAGRLARQAAQESRSAEREAPRVPNGTAPRLAPLSPLPVFADAQPQHSPVDGLGDRDRSLSPEGDGAWDTLLSSITPDPQPPSVGTSFQSTSTPASASASASASGSASASASTSQSTAPSTAFPWYNEDEAEGERDLSGTLTDAEFDRFCFGTDDEGSDMEGEGDGEDMEPWPGLMESPTNATLESYTATRPWPSNERRRSYADVVAHSRSPPQQREQEQEQEQEREEQQEEPGRQESQQQQQSQSQNPDDDDSQVDVNSMQRIIRILMERPDLSDEWWAAVGLSRSLPRETA